MDSQLPVALTASAPWMACLVVVMSVTAAASEDTGYCPLYDFPDQGADWYAAESAPDARYDFHGSLSQPFGDGDDFELGYFPSLDPYGLGPPLTATQSSLYEYVFRHGELEVPANPNWSDVGGGGSGGCSPNCCPDNASCQDSSFCNGPEVCNASGYCRSGTPVYCGDGDSCTADTCDEVNDVCVNTPITAPGEVRSLALWKITPGTANVGLMWYPQPPAGTFNLYRADEADLSDLTCIESALLTTNTSDATSPSAGSLFFYLVTGAGCGGESVLGSDSDGQLRANPRPCPPAV